MAKRQIAAITVVSYVPMEENAADTAASILEGVIIPKNSSVAAIRKALSYNCITEKKARSYSKYKRARKVRFSISVEDIPPARGFRKKYRKKTSGALLFDPHVDTFAEEVEDNS